MLPPRYSRRDPYAILLAATLVEKIMNMRKKPGLTIVLMIVMSCLHLKSWTGFGDPYNYRGWHTHGQDKFLRYVCMWPGAMRDTFSRTGSLDMKRFFLSPFFHVDDLHLVYNMISFLWKGVTLELTMNLHDYVGLLAYCTVASQTLLLLSSYALVIMFGADGPMNACTVGFSGVLFALKYVAARRSPGVTEVYGFQVHTRYATWLELLLIALLVPESSFLGHLCGIVAGIMYVEIPIIATFLRYFIPWGPRKPQYTYSSGTASTSAAARDAGGQSRGPSYTSSRGTSASTRAVRDARWQSRGPNYTSSGGTAASTRAARDAKVPPPSSAARAREEENLQEAIERSLQDNGRPNGGLGGVGGLTEDLRVAPSAPAMQEDEVVLASQRNGGGGTCEDDRSTDYGDIRQRRLQRLGVSSPQIMSTEL